jgi:hypothetical protein
VRINSRAFSYFNAVDCAVIADRVAEHTAARTRYMAGQLGFRRSA